MKKEKDIFGNVKKIRGFIRKPNKVQSLQEKIGATAQQIRQAIEIVGFDREKVEQYLRLNK